MFGNLKTFKNTIKFGILLSFALILSGCGREEQSPYVYMPEYEILKPDVNRIIRAEAVGDYIFLYGENMDSDYNVTGRALLRLNTGSMEYDDYTGMLGHDNTVADIQKFDDSRIFIQYYDEMYMEHFLLMDAEKGSVIRKAAVAESGIISPQEYISYITCDGNGRIFIEEGSQRIRVLNENLEVIGDIPVKEEISGLLPSREGDVYAAVTGMENTIFKRIDVENRSLVASNVSAPAIWGGRFKPGTDVSAIIADYDNVYTVDFANSSIEKQFSWVDVNVIRSDVIAAGQMGNGDFFAITNSEGYGDGSECSLVRIKKLNREDAPKVANITYGCLYLSSDIEREIVRFNKTHGDIKIGIRQYMELVGESDNIYDDAISKFNNDIINGSGVDIIDLSGLPFDRYADKGLFEDLLPYMEGSGMEGAFLENVLDGYRVGDGIYAVIPSFQIQTLAVKASRFPGKTGWTMEEFMDAFKDTPAEKLMDFNDMNYYFSVTLYSALDSFIDWDTGRCNFKTKAFYDMLEYSKGFAVDEYIFDDEKSTFEKLKRDDIAVSFQYLYNVDSFMNCLEVFDHDCNFIGYPNPQGRGTRFSGAGNIPPLALSSQSRYQEQAWDFISIFISQEYQDGLADNAYAGFPIRKSSLQKVYDKAMEPAIEKYEDGTEERVPKGYYFDVDMEVPYYESTKEEIDMLNNLIINAVSEPYLDEKIRAIIEEEKAPYYTGEKTPEEVADIIENRVGLYVAENI